MSFGSLLPISIVPLLGLDAAANITARLPPFSMGATASVQVGLGGSVSLPSMWTGTSQNYVTRRPALNTFNSLTTSFTSQPFMIDQAASASPTAWGGSATISLTPWYQMNLFSVFPIKASPVYSVGASMWTQGTLPPPRLLREGGGRQLAGCISASASTNTGLQISVGATTVSDMLPAISSTLASIIPSSLANTPVTSAATLFSAPSIGNPFSIATPPCPSASPTPSSSPSASPSFGAIIAAAAASSSTASSVGGLPLAAIIGGAAGACVAVALVAAGVTYCIMRQQNKAKLTSATATVSVKSEVATTSVNPALISQALPAA